MLAALVSDADWRSGVQSARDSGAGLICLPLLSFGPYVANELDRAGYEQAERAPSPTWREALDLAGGAWLSASSYESEGEGVFYFTGRLGRDGGEEILWRQRELDASSGRYEPMFAAPGHRPMQTVAISGLGSCCLMLGGDLRATSLWAEAARRGADVVIGASAEDPELWETTRQVVEKMTSAFGLSSLVVNRASGEGGFAGGVIARGPGGVQITEVSAGIYDLELEGSGG